MHSVRQLATRSMTAVVLAVTLSALSAQSVVLPKKGSNSAQDAFITLDKFVLKMDHGISWYDYAWGYPKVDKAFATFRATGQAAQVQAFAEDLKEISATFEDLSELWQAKNSNGTDVVYCGDSIEGGAICTRWSQLVKQRRNSYTGNLQAPTLEWADALKWYFSQVNRYTDKALADLQASPFAITVK